MRTTINYCFNLVDGKVFVNIWEFNNCKWELTREQLPIELAVKFYSQDKFKWVDAR